MALDVYIEGRLAGRLDRDASDRISFVYDGSYASATSSTPLSLSMPKRTLEHVGVVPERWIENLLSDNDDTRAAIAEKFDSRATDAYSLLHHIGLDVAGAVQFVREGESVDRGGVLTPWDDARIAGEIDRLRANPADVDEDVEIGHWSLAGQHGKFALARVGDQWMEPTGTQASTHILKVGMSHLRDSDVAEFVTMRAARRLGLLVPDVELATFEGRMALVVQRYDRVDRGDGVLRLHQEDVCQVLGVSRLHKYQSDGGPSMADVAGALSTQVSRSDRGRSMAEFARLQAFNAVAANTDSHGKNSSVLLRGGVVRLAPAYDLISAALLWSSKTTWFKAKLAMKFGGDYRMRALDARAVRRAAEGLGVDPDQYVGVVSWYQARVVDAFEGAIGEAAAAGVDGEVTEQLLERARDWGVFAERIVSAPEVDPSTLNVTAARRVSEPGRGAPSDSTRPRPACGAYIARSRSRCVLPEGHPGWPTKGHRA